MNKAYKIIWNKTKNCYMVVAEFAKSHSKGKAKALCGSMLSVRTGVAAFMVASSLMLPFMAKPVMASEASATNSSWSDFRSNYIYGSVNSYVVPSGENYNTISTYLGISPTTGEVVLFTYDDTDKPSTGYIQVLGSADISSGGTSGLTGITAGNGITVTTSGTTATVAAKAGTGITVDANGIRLTAGSVASGNANAITGGQAYTELRPANGTYVKQANTTAANLKALDTQLKANTDALDDLSGDLDAKANADASNVASQAAKWGTAIGTGTVTASDGKLVTGKTVYEELRTSSG